MTIFTPNILQERRRRVERALALEEGIVLIGAGRPIPIPGGLDQTYPFWPQPEYYWLTGSRRWGNVLAFDARDGWTHFVRPVDEAERLWEGDPAAEAGQDVAGLPDWLAARAGPPVVILGSPLEDIAGDAELAATLRDRLETERRRKDAAELALLEPAVAATAAGFAKARQMIRPGLSERQIQIELEAEMFRHGAHTVGYSTIVGAGAHAAVFHIEPGDQLIGPEDVVLIDAGGEVWGYTADVTRTYPAGDRFTPRQQAIYDLVLAAQQAAIDQCRAGIEWHHVHRTAAAVLALGLRELGLLNGEVDGLLESEAIALFFPHGIGHMVGLGVRDVGGRAPGRSEDQRYCGARLRVDLPLEENFLMTVEPGLYFVPALLDDPGRREQFRHMVNWAALDSWRSVGGIRIEDNLLITAAAPRIMTEAIPK